MVKLMQNDHLFVVNISFNAKIIIYLLYHTLQFVADRIVTLSGQLKCNFAFQKHVWKTPFKIVYSVRAVVVAQLAEQLLPIPEVHGSNPDTGKF